MKLTGEQFDELHTLFKLGRRSFFEDKESVRNLIKLEDDLDEIILNGNLQGTTNKRTGDKKPD